MNIQYCLPIIKTAKQDVINIIERYKNEYSYFEIWLDYIHDLDSNFVTDLINHYEKRLIFLFRRQNLEKEKMNKTVRNTLIEEIAKSNALVDFDIQAQKALVDSYRGKNLITSYHNYTYTPSDEILSDIRTTMNTYQPKIYKVSTYCQTPDDALRLLKLLLLLKKEKKRYIILGMGQHGMITRVFGTLWKNEMSFAPLTKAEASAPGQLTKSELEKIFTIIKGKSEYQSTKSETNSKYK